MQSLFNNENELPAVGRRKKFWFIYKYFSLLKENLIEILNLDSTSFGTEICVSSFQNFMELFESQFYWKQFQKLLSGNPGTSQTRDSRVKYSESVTYFAFEQ